jgi:hypothetical protein
MKIQLFLTTDSTDFHGFITTDKHGSYIGICHEGTKIFLIDDLSGVALAKSD